MRRLISELSSGTYMEPSKTTMAQYLDRWLDHIKAQVSPRSHERYAEIARKNLAPLIGSVVLSKLQPAQISAAYGKALTNGRRDGSGGLSPRTVHHMHRVLKQALEQAVKWRALPYNPADAVDPPKVERRQMSTYDMAQTAALVDGLRDNRMFIPTLLAVLCGLRRGEIAALRWENVDLSAGQFSVVASVEQMNNSTRLKETKSGQGAHRRPIHYRDRGVEGLAHPSKLRSFWLGVRPDGGTFVCTQADGMPMQPTFITHEWVKLVKAPSGCPGCASTIYAMPTQPTCWPPASILRLPASASVIPRSASPWTSTATLCRGCRRMPSPRLTQHSGRPANLHRWLRS